MVNHKRIYRLIPIVTERPWGGSQLARRLNIKTSISKPGEIIAAAGFENRDTEVAGQGVRLSQLFAKQPELFGVNLTSFPITINLIDASESLSVQVHPNNDYAMKNENGVGCPEAWVVLDCDPSSQILIGHTAQTNQAFEQLVKEGSWDKLFRRVEVNKGDFFFLPPGTVHSIGPGVRIYEVTHASDVVYRLYDHGREDNNRPLQIEKVFDVIYSPQQIEATLPEKIMHLENLIVTEYMDKPGLFAIQKLEVEGPSCWKQSNLGVLTVIKGQGEVNGAGVEVGQSFLIPCDVEELQLSGIFTAMLSSYRAS